MKAKKGGAPKASKSNRAGAATGPRTPVSGAHGTQKVEISIGVLCQPRNDQLCSDIVVEMARSASRLMPERQRSELMQRVHQYLLQLRLKVPP